MALDRSTAAASARAFAAAQKRRLPVLKAGELVVSGRLASDVTAAGVKAREGLVRLCYVEGLRKNPKLRGGVAVRFVIGRDGETAGHVDAASDLPDAAVVGCVVRTFVGLSFPRPEGGIVPVTGPVTFAP